MTPDPVRGGRWEGDYLNCPLTKEEYERFYDALTSAESATVHDFDTEIVLRGVPAHRGDGAPRPRHAAVRTR
jgi:folate-dependent tRNA-U54 methylase TrmFO/GidA